MHFVSGASRNTHPISRLLNGRICNMHHLCPPNSGNTLTANDPPCPRASCRPLATHSATGGACDRTLDSSTTPPSPLVKDSKVFFSLEGGGGYPATVTVYNLKCSLLSPFSIHRCDQLCNILLQDDHIPSAAVGGSHLTSSYSQHANVRSTVNRVFNRRAIE